MVSVPIITLLSNLGIGHDRMDSLEVQFIRSLSVSAIIHIQSVMAGHYSDGVTSPNAIPISDLQFRKRLIYFEMRDQMF